MLHDLQLHDSPRCTEILPESPRPPGPSKDGKPDSVSPVFRGCLYAAPISLALWVLIAWLIFR